MERKVSTGAELHDATQQSDVRRISVDIRSGQVIEDPGALAGWP